MWDVFARVDRAFFVAIFAAWTHLKLSAGRRLNDAKRLSTKRVGSAKRLSTSHIERLNLTLRTCLRRVTRLTIAHSKSLKHHVEMQAIFMALYNFGRKHETLKGRTPAMASGLAEKPWSVKELIEIAAAA
ncbi:MAG: hypothetical protein JNL96_10330 [Planctomycetaceae bacterium]|nr:hypothetical protein [Planctomycetaceae bacterium]